MEARGWRPTQMMMMFEGDMNNKLAAEFLESDLWPFPSPQDCTVESFPRSVVIAFSCRVLGSKCLLCFSLLLLSLPPPSSSSFLVFFPLQASTTWLVSTCAVPPRCPIGFLRGPSWPINTQGFKLKGPASRFQAVCLPELRRLVGGTLLRTLEKLPEPYCVFWANFLFDKFVSFLDVFKGRLVLLQ